MRSLLLQIMGLRWMDGRGSYRDGVVAILGTKSVDLIRHVPNSAKSEIEVVIPKSAAAPNDYRGARYYVTGRWRITTEFLGYDEEAR